MNTRNSHEHHSPTTTGVRVAALLLPLAIAAAGPAGAHAGQTMLLVEDAGIIEGNDGSQFVEVAVNLSKPQSKAVAVNYRTADGTAAAGADYASTSGTLTFAKRQTSKTILVPVYGDRAGEGDEYFLIEFFNPTKGIKLANSAGIVTIWDDEPRVSIGYAYDYEGDSGTKLFSFTVSLSAASDEVVEVEFETQDYSAFADIDYLATSGTVTFAPGDTAKMIPVEIIGNTLPEPEKYFLVVLSNSSPNAVVTSSYGWGTISDDDGYYDYYYDYYYGYYDYGYYYYYDYYGGY